MTEFFTIIAFGPLGCPYAGTFMGSTYRSAVKSYPRLSTARGAIKTMNKRADHQYFILRTVIGDDGPYCEWVEG